MSAHSCVQAVWRSRPGSVYILADAHCGQRRILDNAADLCVPKTSSTSCDQAIFVNQATDASVFSDAVVIEIDRVG